MPADIRSLTGVRGVAAVLIVLYHFGNVPLLGPGTAPYYRVPHGYLAVDLFFMLSGYVMAYVYRDAFVASPWRHYLDFLVKRVARLYPAYVVIATLYLIKILLGLSRDTLAYFRPWDWAGNLLMLTGWGLHVQPIVGVSWAASAELGSYLLLPPLLVVFVRRGPLLAALGCVAALGAVVVIARSGLGSAGPLDVTNGDSMLPLLRAVAGFAIGLGIFRVAHRLDRLSMAVQDALVAGLTLAIVVIGIAFHHDLPIYLLFIPFVALLSRDGRLAQALYGNRLVYHLGLISYSIYLLHQLLLSFAVEAARALGPTPLVYAACVAVALAVIWLLAWLSYTFVEMPGRRWLTAWLQPAKRLLPTRT
ncbi:acyltransferase [Bradyrhizobium sp. U87765 SZCCT0131]|uniref:acyltransferase family protein n=1 Tax=unclassified Bradyrhizobium TaxID=2631580 RepID=UPI001BAC8F7F|nr:MULTISPECIES: acyltransferase [unclassified Bradyrhizobium]MBR1216580.1 acyltransferase [Bradyrhizobium sp. U87765 SZCCT0131]MBR1259664.1 acyltransferase [Bradyrhizobium sp. U87765 SZCCT0134]MBR1305805.1 acyltransferase [Bradyrhizobium sp. U87765 SZCCT0110]MBR1322172.1 acyltransferase [Bradyrhizobium sp. U87765 SZCCT0109]MBR1350549.1 acyltransferase [Bradyrhizobium sp. U87765 SZCCT0048]